MDGQQDKGNWTRGSQAGTGCARRGEGPVGLPQPRQRARRGIQSQAGHRERDASQASESRQRRSTRYCRVDTETDAALDPIIVCAVLGALMCLAALLMGCRTPPQSSTPPPAGWFGVKSVVDGDTIVVSDHDGRSTTVRLGGIDTPETVHPTKPIECHGPQASAALSLYLPIGSLIRLERDIEPTDHFNRLIAYVFDAEDRFVNLEMVRSGAAEANIIEPNTAYAASFGDAERAAKAKRSGLWRSCRSN